MCVCLVASVADAATIVARWPLSSGDLSGLIPAGATSPEFLAGIIAGVLLSVVANIVWLTVRWVWLTSLYWGSHAIRYGSIAAILVALIYFI
jgi:hypothetical protein